jgi:hypothetical protein
MKPTVKENARNAVINSTRPNTKSTETQRSEKTGGIIIDAIPKIKRGDDQ